MTGTEYSVLFWLLNSSKQYTYSIYGIGYPCEHIANEGALAALNSSTELLRRRGRGRGDEVGRLRKEGRKEGGPMFPTPSP